MTSTRATTSDLKLGSGWVVLIIVLLSFLAFSNSLSGDFVFDDKDVVLENHDIQSWGNLGRAFTSHVWAFRENAGPQTPPPLPYYRPIFTAVVTIEYHLFHLNPRGWHLVSLLLHIFCAIAVYLLFREMLNRREPAALAAMLFAAYPIHSEPVSWISSLSDLLFTLFLLLSFWLYLKYQKLLASKGATNLRGAWSMLALSLGFYALSALSKEAALALPLIVLGWEIGEARGAWPQRILTAAKRSAPYFAVTGLYLLLRYIALRDLMWTNPQAPDRPLTLTVLTLPWILCRYLWHLVWPFGLSITYDTRFVTRFFTPQFLVPSAALIISAAALIKYRRKLNSTIWLCLLVTFAPLLPVLNLGQISREEYLIFDRYLYLPAAGWCLLIVLGLDRAASWWMKRQPEKKQRQDPPVLSILRNPSMLAGLLLTAVFTIATAHENTHWADEYSLWSNAARVSPGFWAPHYNTGLALVTEGKYKEARDALLRAAGLEPNEASVFDELGVAYDGLGDRSNALKNYSRALEIDPSNFETLNNLGGLYFRQGDYLSAERLFKSALQAGPHAVAARYNLGLCLIRQKRYSEAAQELESVVQSHPDDANALLDLGLAYEKLGRLDEARLTLIRSRDLSDSRELAARASEALARLHGER